MSTTASSPKTYDHRLRELVYTTQDVSLALDLGVPRSTAYGWIRNEPPEVVTLDALNLVREVKIKAPAEALWSI
jgi:glutamyl-tRNA reductase